MRVTCEFTDLEGTILEGEIISGRSVDPVTGFVDLDDVFTLKTDEGESFKVNGWVAYIRVCENGVGGCE